MTDMTEEEILRLMMQVQGGAPPGGPMQANPQMAMPPAGIGGGAPAPGLGAQPAPQKMNWLQKFGASLSGPTGAGMGQDAQMGLSKMNLMNLGANLMAQSGRKVGPKQNVIGGLGQALAETLQQGQGLAQQSYRNSMLKTEQEERKAEREAEREHRKWQMEEAAAQRKRQAEEAAWQREQRAADVAWQRSQQEATEKYRQSMQGLAESELQMKRDAIKRMGDAQQKVRELQESGQYDPNNSYHKLLFEMAGGTPKSPSIFDMMYGPQAMGGGVPEQTPAGDRIPLTEIEASLTPRQDPRAAEYRERAKPQPGDGTDFDGYTVNPTTPAGQPGPVTMPSPAGPQAGLGNFLMGGQGNPINQGIANAFAGSGDKMTEFFLRNGFAEPRNLQAHHLSDQDVYDMDALLRKFDEKARSSGKDTRYDREYIRLRNEIQKLWESGDKEGAKKVFEQVYG